MRIRTLPVIFSLLLLLAAFPTITQAQERVMAADGTVAAPGLTFNNQTASGLYHVQGGVVGLSNAGTAGITVSTAGATAAPVSLTVGPTGVALVKLAKYSATLSPASVAANTCAEEAFTVTGVEAGDIVYVNKPTSQAGLGVAGVRASGASAVAINFCNATASPIVPTASQAYLFGVLR